MKAEPVSAVDSITAPTLAAMAEVTVFVLSILFPSRIYIVRHHSTIFTFTTMSNQSEESMAEEEAAETIEFGWGAHQHTLLPTALHCLSVLLVSTRRNLPFSTLRPS